MRDSRDFSRDLRIGFCCSTSKQQPVLKGKRCVALITGSAVRQNCDRLSVIPTTPYQLDRIGGHSATND